MRLTVIGCAGSFPGPESAASCYLVEAHDGQRRWNVLLDFGNGALGVLQRHRELDDIDAIVLSHLHPDHCIDMCSYFVVRNYDPLGRFDTHLPVYGPAGTHERLVKAYQVDVDEDLSTAFAFHDLHDRRSFQVGPMTITPFLVNHPVEAYGFRVEADGKVLAYTGDTDSCDALIELERDADLVLTDSAFVDGRDDDLINVHLSGSRAARAAVDAKAKRLMLTHIPAWTDAADCVRDARKHWSGPIELAEAEKTYDI